MTPAMMVAEIIAGHLTGVMALLANRFHMATHPGARGVAPAAYAYASNDAFSFGTGKVGDLAEFASALVLEQIALVIGVDPPPPLPADLSCGWASGDHRSRRAGREHPQRLLLLGGHHHGQGHNNRHAGRGRATAPVFKAPRLNCRVGHRRGGRSGRLRSRRRAEALLLRPQYRGSPSAFTRPRRSLPARTTDRLGPLSDGAGQSPRTIVAADAERYIANRRHRCEDGVVARQSASGLTTPMMPEQAIPSLILASE